MHLKVSLASYLQCTEQNGSYHVSRSKFVPGKLRLVADRLQLHGIQQSEDMDHNNKYGRKETRISALVFRRKDEVYEVLMKRLRSALK